MVNKKRLIDANAFQFEPDPVDNIMNGVLFMGRSQGKTLQQVKYCLKAMIENAPTVDAVEVVHGRWVVYESDEAYGPYDSKDWYKCSVCGKDAFGRCDQDEWYSSPILSDYCPNCGAKMDGDGNDNG